MTSFVSDRIIVQNVPYTRDGYMIHEHKPIEVAVFVELTNGNTSDGYTAIPDGRTMVVTDFRAGSDESSKVELLRENGSLEVLKTAYVNGQTSDYLCYFELAGPSTVYLRLSRMNVGPAEIQGEYGGYLI